MNELLLAALGVLGGGLLIAVSVLVPGRLLSRPAEDALPVDDALAADGPLLATEAAYTHAEEAGA